MEVVSDVVVSAVVVVLTSFSFSSSTLLVAMIRAPTIGENRSGFFVWNRSLPWYITWSPLPRAAIT